MWLMARMRQWRARSRDRRTAVRSPGDSIVAYYWSGGAPAPRKVANVSVNGAYIRTPDTWSPGTVIALTFQLVPEHPGTGKCAPAEAPICVVGAAVVRTEADGFGLKFLFRNDRDKAQFRQFLEQAEPNGNASPERATGQSKPLSVVHD